MKKIKLGSILCELNDRSVENNQFEILTSSQDGIVSQKDYFNKQVASDNNIGYKIIKNGEFTYRSMSDTGCFYINRLTDYEIGIVSPAYPVFRIASKEILPEFLEMYFQSNYFQHQISNQSTGSTRLALKYNKLSKLDIDVPEKNYQHQIIDTLNKIKALISNEENQLVLFDELMKSRFVDLFYY